MTSPTPKQKNMNKSRKDKIEKISIKNDTADTMVFETRTDFYDYLIFVLEQIAGDNVKDRQKQIKWSAKMIYQAKLKWLK